MSNIITEAELTRLWHNKANNCKQRQIPFLLTLEEWIAIYRMRPTLRCAYTDRQFNLRSTTHDDYPSLERIDSTTKGYERGNICFITSKVNRLKADYIETGKSTKGIGEDAYIIQRIKKVTENPDMLAERLKPYQEIFDKIDQRHAEEQAKETQRMERQEASEKQKKINKVQEQVLEQRKLADHYSKIYDMFEGMGLVYGLTFKQHRDVFRRSKSAINGVAFGKLHDKFLWIPNKLEVGGKGIVEKGDFIVCFQEESELLDKLSQSGNLKTMLLNTLKHI